MIVKKPYAFLIKNFKLIHLVLSLLMLFILIKSNNVFVFFNDYANNGYYTLSSDMNSYIDIYMFIIIIFIMMFTSFIYLLLRWKQKSRKLYIFTLLYYFILMISLLYFFNVFRNIIDVTLDTKVIRAYRDITLLMYFPQYIFLLLYSFRATGFNIKKFDFKKDLLDLDIEDKDEEEIEIVFNDNSYKVKRYFRKQLREFKYYVVENKMIIFVIILFIIIGIGVTVYINYSNRTPMFTESEYFDINSIRIKVDESYITNVDYNGKLINNNYNYLIVNTLMQNTDIYKTTIDTSIIRLRIDNTNYYPVNSKNDYFKDLGEGYSKNVLFPSETNNYLLIYEIPRNADYKNATLRLVNSIKVNNDNIDAKYKDVRLSPINYIDTIEKENNNIGDIVVLDDSSLKTSEIQIESYNIDKEFTETFTYCASECLIGTKVIKPSLVGNADSLILKLNMNISLNDSLYINKYIKSNSDFIDYFASINYTINGKKKTLKLNSVNLNNIETNNVYVEINKEIQNATDVYISFNIRNVTYKINLK